MPSNSPNLVADGWIRSSFERHYDVAVSSQVLAGLVRYWESKRGEDDVPKAVSIDPVEIGAKLLPHVILIDVETRDGNEPRFRLRLVGTYAVTTLGRDNTGKYFDECYSEERLEDMTQGVRYVAENRAPMRSIGSAEFADRGWLDLEFVLLPLADREGAICRIILGLDARPLETLSL